MSKTFKKDDMVFYVPAIDQPIQKVKIISVNNDNYSVQNVTDSKIIDVTVDKLAIIIDNKITGDYVFAFN